MFQVSSFKFQRNKGFTLVEMVVVLSLFMAIISVTVGIFISVVQNQRRMLAQQELLSQVSYVQEYVSRAVRAAVVDISGDCLVDDQNIGYPGSIYLLTHPEGGSNFYYGIKFVTKDNICQEFFYDSEDGMFKEAKDGGSSQPIIASKFVIPYAAFVINGDKTITVASQSDAVQPRVTFLLLAQKINTGPQTLPYVFQTTISQRNLNFPN